MHSRLSSHVTKALAGIVRIIVIDRRLGVNTNEEACPLIYEADQCLGNANDTCLTFKGDGDDNLYASL